MASVAIQSLHSPVPASYTSIGVTELQAVACGMVAGHAVLPEFLQPLLC